MPNPIVDQGSLNLLRASVVVSAFPTLNITAPYVHKNGIKLSFQGESVIYDQTLVGAVTSQQPYMIAEAEVPLLKSQALANLYKQQMETNSLLGNVTLRGDAVPLSVYQLSNCSIRSMRPLDFSGQHAEYTIILAGIYYINANLFN